MQFLYEIVVKTEENKIFYCYQSYKGHKPLAEIIANYAKGYEVISVILLGHVKIEE